MLPSDSAVAICKIMVGLRIKAEETGVRDDLKNAFLGLGSARSPQEFDGGVAYAVEQEWVSEDSNRLKLSRTGSWLAQTEEILLLAA
jgi:hypothetical protein